MYSMVLMMALSGTAQTPAGQWVESTGCCGGTPTVSYGCDGGHPGLFKRFFHHKETYSCFGGPYAPAVTPLPIAPVKPLPQAEPLPRRLRPASGSICRPMRSSTSMRPRRARPRPGAPSSRRRSIRASRTATSCVRRSCATARRTPM
jgi:hypothetical protein